ncbi:MAG TPA: hypothetical protein VK633_09500 [Verrucomicrobiae bacterium]|nr:hypothetical protein [Verrucomicrobiae bacterium]
MKQRSGRLLWLGTVTSLFVLVFGIVLAYFSLRPTQLKIGMGQPQRRDRI